MRKITKIKVLITALIIVANVISSTQLCYYISITKTMKETIQTSDCPLKNQSKVTFCCKKISQKQNKTQSSTNKSCPVKNEKRCPIQCNKSELNPSFSFQTILIKSVLSYTDLFKTNLFDIHDSKYIEETSYWKICLNKPLITPLRV